MADSDRAVVPWTLLEDCGELRIIDGAGNVVDGWPLSCRGIAQQIVDGVNGSSPQGMTLRDQFAMVALTGLLAGSSNRGDNGVVGIGGELEMMPRRWARLSYQLADAMVEARKVV